MGLPTKIKFGPWAIGRLYETPRPGAAVSLRVSDLLEQPHLRLETLAGERGLERAVSWAHASDLPNPWDWLAGGELLMKNGRTLPRSAAKQSEFIERLADTSVAALVIGTDPMTPPLARRAAERADALSLAVLRVPYSMSFMAISRAVADAALESEARRMIRTERIYSTIRVGRSDGPPIDFLGRLEAEFGCHLYVLDPGNLHVVITGGREPDLRLVSDLNNALAAHDARMPGVLHLPRRGRRAGVAVDVPYEEPTMLVADHARGTGFDVAMLHHAAMATAIAVGIAALRDDYQSELGSTTLALMLDPSAPGPQPDVLAHRHGLDLSRSYLVAASCPSSDTVHRIEIALRRREIAHVVLAQTGTLWLLVHDVGSAAAVLTARLPEGAPIGVSGLVASMARAPEAATEALFALGVATRHGAHIARFGELDGLSAVYDVTQARALVEKALGRVLRYDHSHGTDLVGSLATFLACRRSWSRSAEALHVHRQTVVYRMKKVAELTGRDLTETADLAELWHALTALALLGRDQALTA